MISRGRYISDFDWLDAPPDDESGELKTARQLDRPKVHRHKIDRREFITGLKRESLDTLIPELPPPDCDLYVIGNGEGAEIGNGRINPLAFDFGTFIPHLVKHLGGRGCRAYVSTWTLNEIHVRSMGEMLADGRLARLTVFVCDYFNRTAPAVYAQLVTILTDAGERGRFLSFKNHVKVIALTNADESQTCVISGSANLSAQPRCEQYVVSSAPDVYSFYVREFFEAMIESGGKVKHSRG